MKEFPKVLAAAKRSQWAVADALVDEVGPRGSGNRFEDCAAYLNENGIHYSISTLRTLHGAAVSFPPGPNRPSWLTPEHAAKAGSPKVLEAAVAVKREKVKQERADGWDVEYTPPTKREIAKVRQAEVHHRMQTEGRVRSGPVRTPPKKDPARGNHSSANRPVGEIQRTINYLEVVGHAERATVLGTKFIEGLAGQKLSKQDTDDLEEFVTEVIDRWKIALDVVRNPLGDAVEQFLQSQEG